MLKNTLTSHFPEGIPSGRISHFAECNKFFFDIGIHFNIKKILPQRLHSHHGNSHLFA